MTRIILFLLLLSPLVAQQGFYVDLAGPWRYSPTDDPSFAQPEFDDSSWETLQMPPQRAFNRQDANGWLRRTVELPDWADRTQLALTLGPFSNQYAVYVNGREIAVFGALGDGGKSTLARTRTIPIPAEALGSRSAVSFAIRVEIQDSNPFVWRIPQKAPYLLTYLAQAPVNAGVESLQLQRSRFTPTLVISVVYLILCIPVLLAWFGERQRSELLWLTALLFTLSIYGMEAVFTIAPGSTPFNKAGLAWIHAMVRCSTWAASLSFAISALRFGRPWRYLVVWLAWLSVQMAFHYGIFNYYMGFGVATGAVAILLIALAWWKPAKEQPAASPHFISIVLMLQAIERIFATGGFLISGSSAEIFVEFGGYFFNVADILALFLTTIILILLLRQVVLGRRVQHRLQGELEAARSAQLSLLGSGKVIHTDYFEIDPVYEPALEVGGDFHWTRVEPDGSLIAVVGDVSGKGLKAAMLVSLAIGILRNEKSSSPGAILAALNEGVVGHTGGGFVTCGCARFAPDGDTTLANAGHLSPYCDGQEVELEAGLPLGIAAGVSYGETVVQGNRFTFVTDGIVEAENGKRELFGFDRTREISSQSAHQIAEAAKAWGQNDDITVVTVRRLS